MCASIYIYIYACELHEFHSSNCYLFKKINRNITKEMRKATG